MWLTWRFLGISILLRLRQNERGSSFWKKSTPQQSMIPVSGTACTGNIFSPFETHSHCDTPAKMRAHCCFASQLCVVWSLCMLVHSFHLSTDGRDCANTSIETISRVYFCQQWTFAHSETTTLLCESGQVWCPVRQTNIHPFKFHPSPECVTLIVIDSTEPTICKQLFGYTYGFSCDFLCISPYFFGLKLDNPHLICLHTNWFSSFLSLFFIYSYPPKRFESINVTFLSFCEDSW